MSGVIVSGATAGAPNLFTQMGLEFIPVITSGINQVFQMGDGLDNDCPQRQVTLTRAVDMAARPCTRQDVATILAREPQARQVLLACDKNTGREHVMGIQREKDGDFENWGPYGVEAPWGVNGFVATKLHDLTGLMRMYQGSQELTDPDHIARYISKRDALFIAAVAAMAMGHEVRLPTEAEFEFIAQRSALHLAVAQNADGPSSIKGYKKDEQGFQALLGAIWQHCIDIYGPYPDGDRVDPTGPLTGSAGVVRGGAWFSLDRCSRAASRYYRRPDFRCFNYGLRLVVPRT